MRVLFAPRQENIFQKFANPHFEISEDYQIIDNVLNNEQIISELAKDFPDITIGRDRTPVEQTLRFLVLKHQRRLSYREFERTLTVNLEDRWFCKITENVPCFKTIQNQLACISEKTIKAINDKVMAEAAKQKLTKGRKMRVDSTITEANIHYPTDASLIADGIRIVTRTLTKLKITPNGYRAFKRKLQQQFNILRTIGRKNKEIRTKAIQHIIKFGKDVVRKTRHIVKRVVRQSVAILQTVIEQGEKVLAGEKISNRIVSIFEPTMRPLRKGKINKSCEFGQETQIQEDEHFITNWELNNKPSDTKFFKSAVDKHQELFGKPPNGVATDRGYWSPENKEYAEKQGVRYVSLPKKGKLNEKEKEFQSTRKFKQLQCFRAGGEAKISLLKRRYGLGRCGYKGNEGMALWVGAGILSCNLMTMAQLLSR